MWNSTSCSRKWNRRLTPERGLRLPNRPPVNLPGNPVNSHTQQLLSSLEIPLLTVATANNNMMQKLVPLSSGSKTGNRYGGSPDDALYV